MIQIPCFVEKRMTQKTQFEKDRVRFCYSIVSGERDSSVESERGRIGNV